MAVLAHDRLSDLDKKAATYETVLEVCEIFGIEKSGIKAGLNGEELEIGASDFPPKEGKALRWVLGSLRQSSNSKSRLDPSVWLLFRILVLRSSLRNVTQYLHHFKFLDILQQSLAELAEHSEECNATSEAVTYLSDSSEKSLSGRDDTPPPRKKLKTNGAQETVRSKNLEHSGPEVLALQIEGLLKTLRGFTSHTEYGNGHAVAFERPRVEMGAKILKHWFKAMNLIKRDSTSLLSGFNEISRLWELAIAKSNEEKDHCFCKEALFHCLLLLRQVSDHGSLMQGGNGLDCNSWSLISTSGLDDKSETFSGYLHQLIIEHAFLPLFRQDNGHIVSSLSDGKVSLSNGELITHAIGQRPDLYSVFFKVAIDALRSLPVASKQSSNAKLQTLFELSLRCSSVTLSVDDSQIPNDAQSSMIKSLLENTGKYGFTLPETLLKEIALKYLGSKETKLKTVHWRVISFILRLNSDIFLPAEEGQGNGLLQSLLNHVTLNKGESGRNVDFLRLEITKQLLFAFISSRELPAFFRIWTDQLCHSLNTHLDGHEYRWTPWEDQGLVILMQNSLESSLSPNQIESLMQDFSKKLNILDESQVSAMLDSCARLASVSIIINGVTKAENKATCRALARDLIQRLEVQISESHRYSHGWVFKVLENALSYLFNNNNNLLNTPNIAQLATLYVSQNAENRPTTDFFHYRNIYQASRLLLKLRQQNLMEKSAKTILKRTHGFLERLLDLKRQDRFAMRSPISTVGDESSSSNYLALDYTLHSEEVANEMVLASTVASIVVAGYPQEIIQFPSDAQRRFLTLVFQIEGYRYDEDLKKKLGSVRDSLALNSAESRNRDVISNNVVWKALLESKEILQDTRARGNVLDMLLAIFDEYSCESSLWAKAVESFLYVNFQYIGKPEAASILEKLHSITTTKRHDIPSRLIGSIAVLMNLLTTRTVGPGFLRLNPLFIHDIACSIDEMITAPEPNFVGNFKAYTSSWVRKLANQPDDKAIIRFFSSLCNMLGLKDRRESNIFQRPAILGMILACAADLELNRFLSKKYGKSFTTCIGNLQEKVLRQAIEVLEKSATLRPSYAETENSRYGGAQSQNFLGIRNNLSGLDVIVGIAATQTITSISSDNILALLKQASKMLLAVQANTSVGEVVESLLDLRAGQQCSRESVLRAAILSTTIPHSGYSNALLKAILAALNNTTGHEDSISWLLSSNSSVLSVEFRLALLLRSGSQRKEKAGASQLLVQSTAAALNGVFLQICQNIRQHDDKMALILELKAMKSVVGNGDFSLGQAHIENTLSSILKVLATDSYWLEGSVSQVIYSCCCDILSSVLAVNRHRLNGRFDGLLQVLQGLLGRLFLRYEVAEQRDQIKVEYLASVGSTGLGYEQGRQFTRVIQAACDPPVGSMAGQRNNTQARHTSEKEKAREQAGERLAHLVLDYCRLQLEARCPNEVREAILPGFFSLLGAISTESRKKMTAIMDKSQRVVMESLMKDYSQQARSRFDGERP